MKNCTVDEFKNELDTYLATVPDEPKLDGQNSMPATTEENLEDLLTLSYFNALGARTVPYILISYNSYIAGVSCPNVHWSGVQGGDPATVVLTKS